MTVQKKLEKCIFSNMDTVEQICSPLKEMGIAGFFYQKVYSSGEVINFSSNSEWSRFFLTNLFLDQYKDTLITDYFFLRDGVSFWCSNPENVVWQEGKNHFGLGNGVTIHEIRDTYFEMSGFYSTIDNHNINNFYANNIDLLKNFILYFKVKAEKLIKKAEAEKTNLILPSRYIATDEEVKKIQLDNQIKRGDFLKRVMKDKIYLSSNDESSISYITKRELDVYYLLIHGKSSKEIAKNLALSYRTVEFYIASLKRKLMLPKTSQLIHYASKYNIEEIWLTLQQHK